MLALREMAKVASFCREINFKNTEPKERKREEDEKKTVIELEISNR